MIKIMWYDSMHKYSITFLLKPTLKINAVYIRSYKSSYVFVVQLNKDK